MPQDLIFAPMGALAFLTLTVLTFVPIRRFGAAFAGRVQRDDFKFGESAAVPGDVSIPNRNYMNLLEAPVLFYVAALMYHLAGRVDRTALVIAWVFVGLRLGHSLVHMTYNHVMHRVAFFALSNAALAAFWIYFFIPR